MSVHNVLDRQGVQPEHVCDLLHVGFVGFMQPDPDECLVPDQFDFAHLVPRRGVGGVFAGQPLAFEVDAAVDQGFGSAFSRV